LFLDAQGRTHPASSSWQIGISIGPIIGLELGIAAANWRGKRAVRPLLIFVLVLVLIAGMQVTAHAQKAKPEIRFPDEDQSKEGTVSHGSPGSTWSDPPLLDHLPPGVGVVGAGRGDIADQLNRAELNRLLRRGPRGAPFP
jgi:hypothetical protein